MKLRGLIPNFYIHVFGSELYIPAIDLPILLYGVCGPIVGRNIYIAHRYMNVKLGTRPRSFISRNICNFRYCAFAMCDNYSSGLLEFSFGILHSDTKHQGDIFLLLITSSTAYLIVQ